MLSSSFAEAADAGATGIEQTIAEGFKEVDERLGKVDERLGKGDLRFTGIEAQLQKQGVLLEAMNGDLKQTMEVVLANRDATNRGFAEILKKLKTKPR